MLISGNNHLTPTCPFQTSSRYNGECECWSSPGSFKADSVCGRMSFQSTMKDLWIPYQAPKWLSCFVVIQVLPLGGVAASPPLPSPPPPTIMRFVLEFISKLISSECMALLALLQRFLLRTNACDFCVPWIRLTIWCTSSALKSAEGHYEVSSILWKRHVWHTQKHISASRISL